MRDDNFVRAAFRSAGVSLKSAVDTCQNELLKSHLLDAHTHYRASARFYLPEAANLFDFNTIPKDLLRKSRLPFEHCAILSESRLIDHRTGQIIGHADRITLVAGIEKLPEDVVTGLKQILMEANEGRDVTPPMFVRSLVRSPIFDGNPWALGHLSWAALPQMVLAAFDIDGDGMISRFTPNSMALPGQELGQELKEYHDDICSALNLAALLSLSNVTHDIAKLPAKAQKKIDAGKKRPAASLPDYRVVTVAGETWSPGGEGKNGTGVRSHHRRGHIRRLASGRHTWVRDTLVRGSREGFVEKHYQIGNSPKT